MKVHFLVQINVKMIHTLFHFARLHPQRLNICGLESVRKIHVA